MIAENEIAVMNKYPKFAVMKTKAMPLMMTLSGAAQRPLARNPVDRQHSTAEMATLAACCFVPELMPCANLA